MEKQKHYVNNADLLEALKAHKKSVKAAKKNKLSAPPVGDYIGECLFQIATRLAMKNNFNGYTYKQDMISDGLCNCLQYIHNFDPKKSSNPFAYFTQIIYYAFLRRIQKEKVQSAIKNRVIEERPFELFQIHAHDDTGAYDNVYRDYLNHNNSEERVVLKKPTKKEPVKEKKKKKLKTGPLDMFMEKKK